MEAVEEIKSRLDIVDIVGEYLPLKPAGTGSFKANCPFHQEKTPSFYVNRSRQSWHCFGCDKGGDLISFVQEMEGMDFPDTLAHLAQKAGVELPKFDARASTDKKRLFEVNDLAAKFFRAVLLTSPVAEEARAYVVRRGIDDLTGDVWRIGYAPDSWDSLTNALKAKGVTEDELLKVGLVQKSDRPGMANRVYDRFRGRVMFTICDVHGNVVGFTGRILSDDKTQAKYVNTPETALYKKSMVLYGLDKAKGDIKRQDLAVIVEGNMDVVSSHQFGIPNVVASSGTALTGEQLGLLKRFTTNLAIAFDADAAGNAATLRGLDLARQQDFNLRVITLPEGAGKDPDDAVRKNPEIWKQAIKDAIPVIEWVYRNAFRGHDSTKPEDKKKIASQLAEEFRRISNAIERDAWVRKLAQDLDVSEDAIRDAIRMAKPANPSPLIRPAQAASVTKAPEKPSKSPEEGLMERIMAVLVIKPELEPLARSILVDYDLAYPPETALSTYLTILADREFQDQSVDALRRELERDARVLRDRLITQRRADLEREMREAERVGDVDRIQALLAQFSSLHGNS